MLFRSIGTFFDNIIDAAKEFGGKTKDAFEEAKVGEKFSMAGNAIVEGSKTAGSFIYEKTMLATDVVVEKGKELSENPTIKDISEKAKEGFNKATSTIAEVIINI